MTHRWTQCPDCLRSDGHHPLCPSEHLPLKYDHDIDEQADEAWERERDLDEGSGVVP